MYKGSSLERKETIKEGALEPLGWRRIMISKNMGECNRPSVSSFEFSKLCLIVEANNNKTMLYDVVLNICGGNI